MKSNIFKYLKTYKVQAILAPLFKMLEALFELFVPIIMKNIIDIGIKNGDKIYIIKMSLILLLLAIVGLCASITAQYFSAKAAVGFSSKVRHVLFEHIQKLSFSDIDNIGTSTLITRLTSDVNQVQTGVNMALRLLLRSPFIVFGSMIMAFTIDAHLALIFVILIPILSLIVFAIILLTKPLYQNIQKRLDKIMQLTRENLSGARNIRAFAIEDKEISSYNKANNTLVKAEIKGGILSYLMNPLTYVIINLGIVVLIYYGQDKVYTGDISQGNLIALYNYMSQILVELIKLANMIITASKAIASKKRIEAVLNIQPKQNFNENDYNEEITSIDFKDVCFRFNGSNMDTLSNINLSIKKGDTVGIIGPTGAGKTCLVHLITRFYDATCGTISINGININQLSKDYVRNHIGIVLQKANLFKGTIKENIKFGNNNITDEDIDEAINNACATNIINKKENGIDSIILQGGKNLSGGERQRLSIARILARKPDVLILDDSTSALDYLTDVTLRENIKNLKNKPITIIVSQRSASVMNANKIVVIEDGKISGIGTHEELLKSNDDYKEIYYSQHKDLNEKEVLNYEK